MPMSHRLLRPFAKAFAILGGVLSAIGGVDIPTQGSVVVYYDGTDSRWRAG